MKGTIQTKSTLPKKKKKSWFTKICTSMIVLLKIYGSYFKILLIRLYF